MTDNEIIKALECCLSQEYISDCEKCQYFAIDCRDKLIEQALALINRQKEEIERLNTENNKNFDKWNILEEKTKKRYAELYQEAKSVVQAEAVREFAEKLKEKADIEIFEDYLPSGERYQLEYKMVDIDDIDDLVKEMTNVIS